MYVPFISDEDLRPSLLRPAQPLVVLQGEDSWFWSHTGGSARVRVQAEELCFVDPDLENERSAVGNPSLSGIRTEILNP